MRVHEAAASRIGRRMRGAAIAIAFACALGTPAAAVEYESALALATDLNGSRDSGLEQNVLTWLREGGDPNLVMDPDGNTFTHYAATNLLSILREALLRGGDPKRKNKFGATPLHFSASQSATGPGPEAIRLLMLAGADSGAQDRRGGTVLHTLYEGVETQAALPVNNLGHTTVGGGKRADILQALLRQAGANPDTGNNGGDTPLMMLVRTKAAMPDRREHIAIFLRHGADPDARNNAGATPLIEALNLPGNSRYGLSDVTEIVRLLLKGGADPDLRHANGDTPLIAAAKHPDDIGDEMQALLAGGADPCLQDRNGKLAYDYTEEGSDGRRVLDRAGGNPGATNSKCAGGDGEAQEAESATPFGPNWFIVENQPCQVYDPYPFPNMTLTWSGACIEGKASGEGRVVWQIDDKTVLFVGRLQEGKLHGYGTLVWSSGYRLEGEWLDSRPHGRATETFESGEIATCDWRRGERVMESCALH